LLVNIGTVNKGDIHIPFFNMTGAIMSVWVIVYGIIQIIAPKLIKGRTKGKKPDGRIATELAVLLTVVMSVLVLCISQDWFPSISLVAGLYLFGVIFAVNSSVHSFLILDYAEGDKAAINVGFYYMANASGRLVGTLLSGVLYQVGGINACLSGAAVFLLITTLISLKLPRSQASPSS
jgi:predicted MFS family arabinose efflux permease